MKKIVLVFLAAGAACAALGIILGKKYKIRFCDAEFDDEDSVDDSSRLPALFFTSFYFFQFSLFTHGIFKLSY